MRCIRRPGIDRVGSYTPRLEVRRSRAVFRKLMCVLALLEFVDAVASRARCSAECRSAVRLRSRSYRPRISRCTVSNSSIQRTTPLPVVSDEAKLGETADRFEDWSDGTIAWQCGRGEIGNRAGFRCPCSKELEGSSPSARTGVHLGPLNGPCSCPHHTARCPMEVATSLR